MKNEEKMLSLLETLTTQFNGLNTKFDTLETKFDNLETKFDTLETKFDNLEAKFDNLDAKVTNLETRMENVETNLTEVKQTVTLIETEHGKKLDGLFDGYALNHEIITETRADVKTIKNRLDMHDVYIASLSDKTRALA